MLKEISAAAGVDWSTAPRSAKALAQKLSKIHGDIEVHNDSGGLHFYLACPDCLKRDGKSELRKKHLTINVERYLGLGGFKNLRGTGINDASAMCHKTSKKFLVSELLEMMPVDVRGIPEVGPQSSQVKVYNTSSRLVEDANGNMVPEGPGDTIPITECNPNNPGVKYLLDRDYNLESLWNQFRCSWCVQQLPPEKGVRGYRPMPDGWYDTSQGRVILFCDMLGVQKGWQARVIDKIVNDTMHMYWHPYREEWVLVRVKVGDEWVLTPDYVTSDEDDRKWGPSKYRTAPGAARREIVMGLDAAIRFNNILGKEKGTCFIVEGPLDAGRIGPPALAILGKYMSEYQAAVVAKHFSKAVIVADNDFSGKSMKEICKKVLGLKMEVDTLEVPDGFKDIGEMSQAEATKMIQPYLFG